MQQIKKSLSILFLDSLIKEQYYPDFRAIAPAGNRWKLSFLSALQRCGAKVATLGHLPEPLWPKGKPYPRLKKQKRHQSFSSHNVSYWNLPLYRDLSLKANFIKQLRNYLDNTNPKPDVILSYNLRLFHNEAGKFVQNHYGIPWVYILADLDEMVPDWEYIRNVAKGASGHVFLSHNTYRECPCQPKFHFDGIVKTLNNLNERSFSGWNNRPKKFVFTGSQK